MANLYVLCTALIVACSFLQAGSPALAARRIAPAIPNIEVSGETGVLQKFVGSWHGTCQDGRTFVVVALKQNGNQLGGTVSIGNMHGDDEGACMLVLAPPVPEHAQNISNSVVKQNTLSFEGAKRPDGTSTRFELTLLENGDARLKMSGSPVEDHPWQLTKASSQTR